MNDWKKIEPPTLVLSLYSEEQEMALTVLSTGAANVFIAVIDDPTELYTGDTFVGTLAQIGEKYNIPPRILVGGYCSSIVRKQEAELGADYHNKIMEQRQGRRHRLSAQDLIEKDYITIPVPPRKMPSTSVNWELNIAPPKYNGDINEHGKDLSQFLSGWWKDQIPSWAQWLCIDGSGQTYWFEEKPEYSNYGWVRTAGEMEHGPKCNIDRHNFRELIWERKTKSNV